MRESERGSWKYEWRYESAATVATTTVVSNAAVSTAMDGDAAVSTNGGNGNAATDDVRSGWMKVISVKVIRKKQTGQSECYGFVEFYTHEAAEKVLQSYNGTMMPNAEQPFRLNWSAFSTGEKRADAGAGSDLSFLFDDESERSRAMTEMNGIYCSGRAMRICVATPKKPSAMQQYSSQGGHASNGAATQASQSDSRLSNTTNSGSHLARGRGMDCVHLTPPDPTRWEYTGFVVVGNVVSVKIPAGKGCGFVQFSDR
ncbi:Polyadenylate-binding protein RBP47 [Capsicum annuum]|nr:Polyadenylate-binding protein RBP47 [Capsicum annuum]